MTLSPQRIQAKVSQMDMFLCTCDTIAETHTKGDCAPMFHAMSWHKSTVYRVATITEANEKYPRFDRDADYPDHCCYLCGTVK